MFIVFEILRGLFLNVYPFCRRKTSFERSKNSRAKIRFEMHSIEKLPKLAIFEKSSFFFQKESFFKKIQILKVLRTVKQNYILRRILEFLLNFCVFEKFQRSFRKKPSSKRFEISWVKTQFEKNCISNMPN